jgi:hypothetical protein
MDRGYNPNRLNRQFTKVVGNYRTEFARFAIPNGLDKWFKMILESNTDQTSAKIVN